MGTDASSQSTRNDGFWIEDSFAERPSGGRSYDHPMTQNGQSDPGPRSLFRSARAMTASPLLYIGAVTVVVANELGDLLVEQTALSETLGALALFPIALVLLYAQLVALAYYRRARDTEPPRRCGVDA